MDGGQILPRGESKENQQREECTDPARKVATGDSPTDCHIDGQVVALPEKPVGHLVRCAQLRRQGRGAAILHRTDVLPNGEGVEPEVVTEPGCRPRANADERIPGNCRVAQRSRLVETPDGSPLVAGVSRPRHHSAQHAPFHPLGRKRDSFVLQVTFQRRVGERNKRIRGYLVYTETTRHFDIGVRLSHSLRRK